MIRPAKRPVLSGRLRCSSCRTAFHSTWHTTATILFCHLCGGECLPEGPQYEGGGWETSEMFRLELAQVRRALS